jgi:serralysin
MADVLALQNIYGANSNNDGNTTYSYTDSTQPVGFCIWDSSGSFDTIDVSTFGSTVNQLISLSPGTFSNIGGLSGNLSIAIGTTIEKAIGGAGSDLLVGNDVSNVLIGGSGNDTLSGGVGNDTLSGGGGVDTFQFAVGEAGTPSSSVFDLITDFTSNSDIIDFTSDLTIVTNGSQVSGVASISNFGLASFDSSDDSTQKRLEAAEKAINEGGTAAVGQSVLFQGAGNDSGNAYLFISDGVDGIGAGDVLIRLQGLLTSNPGFNGMTITNGNAVLG